MTWLGLVLALSGSVANVEPAAEPESEVCSEPNAQQPCPQPGGVALPVLIKRVSPEIPANGAKMLAGPVVVTLTAAIGRKGRVEEVTPLAPFADPAYEREAIKAVKKWRYRPAVDSKGNPVRVWMTVKVTYSFTPDLPKEQE